MDTTMKWGRSAGPKDSAPEKSVQSAPVTPATAQGDATSDADVAERVEGRWGRNPKPLPTAGEKLAKAADEITDTVSETASAATQAVGNVAAKTNEAFNSAAQAGWRYYLGKRNSLIAGSIALAVSGGGYLVMSQFTAEKYLESLDPDFRNKCYSLHKRHELTSEPMRQKMEDSFRLMRLFGQRGAATADRLAKSGYTFCYGIDSIKVSPKAHWDGYDIYFSNSQYPAEMTALYMTLDDKSAFWDAKTQTATSIRSFVPQSGLIWSRARNAVAAVEDVRNIHRAMGDDIQKYPDNINSDEWQYFLKENPHLEKTLASYLATFAQTKDEQKSMSSAMMTFMQDGKAVDHSDIAFLKAYNDHVRNLEVSERKYIYKKSYGSGEYAFVDADRDGVDDDLIRVYGWYNEAIEYNYNYGTSAWSLYHKTREYDCSTTDDKGNRTSRTCEENVREVVNYISRPADEAASVHLHPQTLSDLARLTETDFLSAADSQKILTQPQEGYPGQLQFARLYNQESLKWMNTVEDNRAKFIPHNRDTGRAVPGLGLGR